MSLRNSLSLLLVVIAAAGCSHNPPSGRPASQPVAPPPPPAATDSQPQSAAVDEPESAPSLALDWKPDASLLTIVLRNAGRGTIKVDRELVFFIDIDFFDAEGKPIWPKEIKSIPRPDDLADRFVVLRPGESLTRTLRVADGYDFFTTGWGTTTDGMHVPLGYLARHRLPAGTAPVRIRVSYGSQHFMYLEDFRFYTRLDAKALGIYEGPLDAEIATAGKSDGE